MSQVASSPRRAPRAAANVTLIRQEREQATPLGRAVAQARRCLLDLQQPDGHWVAELQGDTILESEYILMMAFLGRQRDEVCLGAARYLLDQQMADGGWNNYPGGPADVSVSVKAYFALKLTGHSVDHPAMRRARRRILSLGGAGRCNSFTNFYLALLGQIPYDTCPAVPPEMIFLPKWAYFNIHAMSSWTRTIVLPLSIFYAHKPVCRLAPEENIRELFAEPPEHRRWMQSLSRRWITWHNFFLVLDRVFKFLDPHRDDPTGQPTWRDRLLRPLAHLRAAAVRRAADWMLAHFEDSDGVGAIFPPMIYTVISLRCLGYADESPEMTYALKQLTDLMINDGDRVRLQPCFSPVWDTALALNALAFSEHDSPLSPSGGEGPGVRGDRSSPFAPPGGEGRRRRR